MTRGDGRAIFGGIYFAATLMSIWLFFIIDNNPRPSYGDAGAMILCILSAVFFAIIGLYKLLTLSKGKSNNKNQSYNFGEKRSNSNIEVKIWRNKLVLGLIFLLGFFVFTLF
tara:strand:+ start:7743 stop:8078 length:336 start_codon:yes stop_codon:yes gene_type:complete